MVTQDAVQETEATGNGQAVQPDPDNGVTARKPAATPKLRVVKVKARKRGRRAKKAHAPKATGRTRAWSFPASSFEEALPLAVAMRLRTSRSTIQRPQ